VPENEALAACPLVVDLDGTLTPTDTLVEGVLLALKRQPWLLLLLPWWLLQGRAVLKREIAARAVVVAPWLPYRADLLAYLHEQRATGRRIVLATAARVEIAQAVAAHLGLFDLVLATDGPHNLKGQAKLTAIRAAVGNRFSYAGDSRADLPIWAAATAAVPVGVGVGLMRQVQAVASVERIFAAPAAGLRVWLKALRVHQWLKNLLLGVPMLTAFGVLDLEKWFTLALAFVAFSLVASATYLVNDMLDIESDRQHPRKRLRPFASGALPLTKGAAVSLLLLGAGLGFAGWLSPSFLAVTLLYLFMTGCYSWAIKGYVLIDVVMLACLYTLRIIAGALAIQVAISSWLMAFSVFLFLSLALVKRCAELVVLQQQGKDATHGRDYRVGDLAVLWPLGVGAGMCAVVVFGLFVSAPETVARYPAHQLLWLMALTLVYWLARLWVKTARGEMDDDPIVYALRDRGSRWVLSVATLLVLCARLLPGWSGA
jgi:4-hydroxybenzoate polyprenyltransferase